MCIHGEVLELRHTPPMLGEAAILIVNYIKLSQFPSNCNLKPQLLLGYHAC